MRALRFSLTIGCLLVIVGIALGEIIHVPDDYPTIQDAIYAAATGDTIQVADGTYTGAGNRDITFVGKAIVVMSENGPENCVIDCGGIWNDHHRGFHFYSGEDSTSVLKGFTIKNGYVDGAPGGGGIYCNHSSPTIVENIIMANWVYIYDPPLNSTSAIGNFALTTNSSTITGNLPYTYGGGGIRCYYASPTIIRNTIKENVSSHWEGGTSNGGGIQCYSSSPIIKDNVIENNSVSGDGGGIYCGWGSSPTITGNTIEGNTSSPHGHGAGIGCDSSAPTITGNTISGNTGVYGSGGGIRISGGSSTNIMGNTIMGNVTYGSGGGISCSNSSATIMGNTITGNTANGNFGHGGGISCSNSSATIMGNTITGNTSHMVGGGIYCYWSSPIIKNSILWGNWPDEIYNNSGYPTVTYSDIQGGWLGVGNIDEDPMFVIPGDILTLGDYRLLWESPCIDTGHPDSLDADGTRSDIGAHFFNQDDYLTIYLTPNATAVLPGGLLGVTYTMINRWDSPESCWRLSQARRHGGAWFNLFGPHQYTLPANYTGQVHIAHPVPNITPTGMYEYRSLIGIPPGTLYDEDSFIIKVTE